MMPLVNLTIFATGVYGVLFAEAPLLRVTALTVLVIALWFYALDCYVFGLDNEDDEDEFLDFVDENREAILEILDVADALVHKDSRFTRHVHVLADAQRYVA